MKKIIISILCGLLLCVSLSCGEKKEKSVIETEPKPEKLVVYINGIPHTSETETMYPTTYTVGPRRVQGVVTADGGNIYQQALKEYEERTGINIEIRYLEESGSDERYVLQELYEEGEPLPDLVVASKHHPYDYYNMAHNNILMDFSSYIAADEERQSEEFYFQKIMEAGKIHGKQFFLPLTFNLNALITSESYLREVGLSQQNEMNYEDVLFWLQKSCQEMKNSQGIDAIYEADGPINGPYIISILNAAAHVAFFDEELNSVEISEEALASIYEVMVEYIGQEYANLYGYEDMTYEQLTRSGQSKKLYISSMTSGHEECIGMFLSGGRGGGFNFYHNILMDAAFFNSTYKEKGDNMVMIGIPTYDDADAYSANVDTMMFSFASCEYPDAVYDLMCYLMDYPFIMETGLSVNKKTTEQQLEDVQNTVLSLYPDEIAWALMNSGILTKEQIMDSMIDIDPLDEVYIEMIRHMLENMVGASISYYPMEGSMFYRVMNEIGSGNMTAEEAAEWTIEKMEERLVKFDENIAFYDKDYEFDLMGLE